MSLASFRVHGTVHTCLTPIYHSHSLDYPSVWNNEGLRDLYLHEELNNCCAMFFYAHGKECASEDVCASVEEDGGMIETTTPAPELGETTTIVPGSTEPVAITDPPQTSTVTSENDTSTVSTRTTATEVPACESGKWHLNEDSSRCTNR